MTRDDGARLTFHTMITTASSAPSAPWTVGACAAFMGFTPWFIRRAITRGMRVGTATVRLDAEVVTVGGRRLYRIHLDRFSDFLTIIGWHRLPTAEDRPRVSRRSRATSLSAAA